MVAFHILNKNTAINLQTLCWTEWTEG